MLKRMSWMFAVVAILILLLGVTSAQAAGGTYDGISWRVEDNVLILGTQGETQTLTNRSSRIASSWPWYHYGSTYYGGEDSYIYDIHQVKIEGTVIAQGSLAYMFTELDVYYGCLVKAS